MIFLAYPLRLNFLICLLESMLRTQNKERQGKHKKLAAVKSQKALNKENPQKKELSLTNRDTKKRVVHKDNDCNEGMKELEEDVLELSRVLRQLRSKHQALEFEQAELHRRLKAMKRCTRRKKYYQEVCSKIRLLADGTNKHDQHISLVMASPVLQEIFTSNNHCNEEDSHCSQFY